MNIKLENTCCWISDEEGCNKPALRGKSYCQSHYDRVYLKVYPETADYIVDKEVNELLQDVD